MKQKDPVWRENGKSFVESVTRLLERLLDYRNVGQVRIIVSMSYSDKNIQAQKNSFLGRGKSGQEDVMYCEFAEFLSVRKKSQRDVFAIHLQAARFTHSCWKFYRGGFHSETSCG